MHYKTSTHLFNYTEYGMADKITNYNLLQTVIAN